MTKILISIILLFLVAPVHADILLSVPEEADRLEYPEGPIAALVFLKSKIFSFKQRSNRFFENYLVDVEKNNTSSKFGGFSKRDIDADHLEGLMLRGAEEIGERYLFFDGNRFLAFETDREKLLTLIHRTIPWDLIRPAPDRGGEATRGEIAEFRELFRKSLEKTSSIKLVSILRVPKSWKIPKSSSKVVSYFAASRIPNFPLLLLECQPDESSQCVLVRSCNLNPRLDIPTEAILGLGVSEKRKLLIFGDPTKHRLVAYHWQSCFQSKKSKDDWILPKSLHTPTAVSVDENDKLWVVTGDPYSYFKSWANPWKDW